MAGSLGRVLRLAASSALRPQGPPAIAVRGAFHAWSLAAPGGVCCCARCLNFAEAGSRGLPLISCPRPRHDAAWASLGRRFLSVTPTHTTSAVRVASLTATRTEWQVRHWASLWRRWVDTVRGSGLVLARKRQPMRPNNEGFFEQQRRKRPGAVQCDAPPFMVSESRKCLWG